jgi:hypothetical protein
LRVLALLVLEPSFQLLDLLLQAVEVDLQLLLDANVLADLGLCLLDGGLEGVVVLADDVAAWAGAYMLAACCSLSTRLIREKRRNSRKSTTLLPSSAYDA